MNLIFFVFWHMQLYMSWYIRSFFRFTFLNILDFFKYSCTNIFRRRSLYTFYQWGRYAANQDSSYCVIHNHISWIQGILPVFSHKLLHKFFWNTDLLLPINTEWWRVRSMALWKHYMYTAPITEDLPSLIYRDSTRHGPRAPFYKHRC